MVILHNKIITKIYILETKTKIEKLKKILVDVCEKRNKIVIAHKIQG